MRAFRGEIHVNNTNESIDYEFIVDDDATENDIKEAAKEAAIEEIGLEWDYEEVE